MKFDADILQVDYNKLAELGNYKNAASATTAYCNAKKKLLSTEAASKITDREREFLVLAWQSFKAEPQVCSTCILMRHSSVLSLEVY